MRLERHFLQERMLRKMMHKNKIVALLIFFIISLIFVYPIFQNIKNWGIHDWDQHLMYNGVPKQTILKFNQFPLWNPYYCGGNAMLANPQSSFLNPLFISVLIFGEVLGLKLLILFYLVIGLFGMFLLSRKLGISMISSYLSSFVFMLSGLYAMHLSVGHTVWVQMALIPYVFLFYLKSLKQIKYIFLSSLFMAFIFLSGGVYPLFFIALFLVFYSILMTVKGWKKLRLVYLKNILMIFLLFILFSSIKLIPTIEFTNEHSFVKKDIQDSDFKKIFDALTFRDVELRMDYMYDYSINGHGVIWGWHEYHAYIGFIPLILFLLGSVLLFRKEWPLILIAIIFFFIAWGNNSIINIWEVLRQLPFMSDLHGPSRFLTVFVFSSSLIIGKFTSIFENKGIFFDFGKRKFNVLKIILAWFALIIFIDLFLVNSQLFEHSFVREPLEVEEQEFTQVTGDREKTQYPIFLSNLGIVNCFERVKPELKAIPEFDTGSPAAYSNFIGMTYMLENNKTQQITYFSPNKVIVETDQSGTLVLNQNYVKGWKVKDGEVKNVNGLIGTDIERNKEIVFYYLPNSFVFGFIVSLISIIIGLFLFYKYSNLYK